MLVITSSSQNAKKEKNREKNRKCFVLYIPSLKCKIEFFVSVLMKNEITRTTFSNDFTNLLFLEKMNIVAHAFYLQLSIFPMFKVIVRILYVNTIFIQFFFFF